jgi:hypothetical protein
MVRVVNDLTGNPIAGARIEGWSEAGTPHAESWEDLRKQSVVTDRDGMACIRHEDGGQWFFIEAPGYAPVGEMGLEEEFRLGPGVDVSVEIRDWLGQPRAGVEVELLLGCGHTPAVRTVTTDARGRAVLRCVEPGRGTLWLRGEGIRGLNEGYSGNWDELPVEDGVLVIHAEPAPVYEGIILYHDGTPAVDAAVGGHDSHRGPWTATDAQGRFRLVGLGDDRATIQAWPFPGAPQEAGSQWGDADLVPGVASVVRLDPPDWLDIEIADPETVNLQLQIRAPVGPGGFQEPLDELLDVVAIREGDGAVEFFEPYIEGTESVEDIDLMPGRWELRWGTPAGPIREARTVVEVGVSGRRATLVLGPNPTWSPRVMEIDAAGALRPFPGVEYGDFTVIAESGNASFESDELPLYVPAEGPFAVLFETEDGRVARAVLDSPPGEDAPPLIVPPVDEAPEKPPMMTLPYEGDFPEAMLRVLLPDGSPAANARVTVRGGASENMSYSISGSLDDAGTSMEEFRRHDEVTIQHKGIVGLPPLVARIDGPGPWTLRWPSGVVSLRAVDGTGNVITDGVQVFLGGTSFDMKEGALDLLGLPAGPIRFQIAAPGYVPRDLRVVLQEGERRALSIALENKH